MNMIANSIDSWQQDNPPTHGLETEGQQLIPSCERRVVARTPGMKGVEKEKHLHNFSLPKDPKAPSLAGRKDNFNLS